MQVRAFLRGRGSLASRAAHRVPPAPKERGSTNFVGRLVSLIDEFIERTSKIKLEITGDDLIKMGVKGGKKVGEILDKVLELKIKNPKMSKEEEIEEAKQFYISKC